MMAGQLGLDGTEVDRAPRTRALTERQREVLRFIRAREIVTPTQIGRLMHAGRETGYCRRVEVGRCCRHASSDGSAALQRLEARGLVEHRARGVWTAVARPERWVDLRA